MVRTCRPKVERGNTLKNRRLAAGRAEVARGIHQRAALLVLLLLAICFLVWFLAPASSHFEDSVGSAILWSWVWGLPVYFVVLWRLGRRHRAMVRARGWRCPRCEYLLQGLPDRGACPECSHEYDVARSLREAEAELRGSPDVRT